MRAVLHSQLKVRQGTRNNGESLVVTKESIDNMVHAMEPSQRTKAGLGGLAKVRSSYDFGHALEETSHTKKW